MATCEHRDCRSEFKPNRDNHKFCSSTCRMKEWDIQHPRLPLAGLEVVKPTEQQKKKTGMESAAKHYADILNTFQTIAKELGAYGPISIDEVRSWADRNGIVYTPGNWCGSTFKGSHWECCGYQQATHAGSHGRVVRLWRLKV